MKLLKKGDRIRLKVRTISGWKGLGTVSEDQMDNIIAFFKDGEDHESSLLGHNYAMRHEVAVIRSKKL